MRFNPKTEHQIASENLLPPGTYGFEIVEAEDTVSKANNEMIKLTVHVFSEDGTPTTVFDYLMEKLAGKLRHAAEACGLLPDYEEGKLEAFDFRGKTGRCKVAIQKDKSGQYPDKNSIADYLRPDAGAASPARQKTPTPDIDDDIPF